jgi:hypothetical protein
MPGSVVRQKTLGLKMAMGQGAECTPEMLEKINRFTLTPLKAEDVYVRKLLLAHNCIDRDNERFPETMLDQFATTIVGKSLLVAHNRKETGSGLFFDAFTEEITPEQFKSLTGESLRMPDGMERCKCLWAWFYTLKTPGSEEWLKWIDGGIIRHCSIGFAAADLVAIRKEPNGPALYWEYVPPGEALEGSLVWLGAQPGATIQKALQPEIKKTEEEKSMKEFLARLGRALGLSKALEEDTAVEAVKSALDAKDAEIAALKRLEPLAEEGKAYRKGLVDDTIKMGTLIEEVPSDAETQKKEAEFLATLPIDRLKMLRDKYEARARGKFPTHSIFTGKDQSDREQRGKEGEALAKETKGKKDFSRPEHNELFGTVER